MNSLKSVFFAITLLLLVISCSDKKDSNPLEAKNDAPVLEIIGFESNQLVFKEDTWYDFRFKAFDPDGSEPDVSLKVLNNTGEIKITDTSQGGLYLAQFKPFSEGEHEIEITVTDKVKTVSDKLNILMAQNQPPRATSTCDKRANATHLPVAEIANPTVFHYAQAGSATAQYWPNSV